MYAGGGFFGHAVESTKLAPMIAVEINSPPMIGNLRANPTDRSLRAVGGTARDSQVLHRATFRQRRLPAMQYLQTSSRAGYLLHQAVGIRAVPVVRVCALPEDVVVPVDGRSRTA